MMARSSQARFCMCPGRSVCLHSHLYPLSGGYPRDRTRDRLRSPRQAFHSGNSFRHDRLSFSAGENLEARPVTAQVVFSNTEGVGTAPAPGIHTIQIVAKPASLDATARKIGKHCRWFRGRLPRLLIYFVRVRHTNPPASVFMSHRVRPMLSKMNHLTTTFKRAVMIYGKNYFRIKILKPGLGAVPFLLRRIRKRSGPLVDAVKREILLDLSPIRFRFCGQSRCVSAKAIYH